MSEKLSRGEHLAPIGELTLSYFVAGEGPLLFVTSPGWGIGSRYLQRGLTPLLAHFKTVFITTRGSGFSTRPADSAQMGSANMADDIDLLRQYLGQPRIDLLGHSNGGAIAISYAARYAAPLRKLVLTSSQLIGFDASKSIQTFLQRATTDPRYREAVPYIGKPRPEDDAGFRQHFLKTLPLYLHDPEANAATFESDMEGPFSAWAYHAQAKVDQSPAADQTSELDNIRAKTLIIVGRHCWVCPVVISEHLNAKIPDSRLQIFEGSGHFPWIEEPGRFFPAVIDFLRSDCERNPISSDRWSAGRKR
jgi:proline iminopeptidase